MRRLHKILYLAITALLLIANHLECSAKSEKPVNVLTWWGYLDDSKAQITEIERQCHTKITFDDYYSNDQFIDRLNNHTSNYDIAIFSESIFDSIKNSITLADSSLYLQSNNYNPIIRAHYLASRFPHNIVYFVHSLTGFLYNPSVITISRDESIHSIFQNAGKNIVVMIDDPVEVNFLINLLSHKESANQTFKNSDLLTWDNFKGIFQNSHVIITNSPQRIVTLPDFAFAFQWSGDAIDIMEKNHGKLRFLVHPKLSYITTDLLAELNNEPNTNCVAKALISKSFLNNLQDRSYYISPYGNCATTSNKNFEVICNQTMKALPSLPWLNSMSPADLEKAKGSWSMIRFKLMQQNA